MARKIQENEEELEELQGLREKQKLELQRREEALQTTQSHQEDLVASLATIRAEKNLSEESVLQLQKAFESLRDNLETVVLKNMELVMQLAEQDSQGGMAVPEPEPEKKKGRRFSFTVPGVAARMRTRSNEKRGFKV